MSDETDQALADLDGERMRLVVQRDFAQEKLRAVEAAINQPYPPSPFADNIVNRIRAALAGGGAWRCTDACCTETTGETTE